MDVCLSHIYVWLPHMYVWLPNMYGGAALPVWWGSATCLVGIPNSLMVDTHQLGGKYPWWGIPTNMWASLCCSACQYIGHTWMVVCYTCMRGCHMCMFGWHTCLMGQPTSLEGQPLRFGGGDSGRVWFHLDLRKIRTICHVDPAISSRR